MLCIVTTRSHWLKDKSTSTLNSALGPGHSNSRFKNFPPNLPSPPLSGIPSVLQNRCCCWHSFPPLSSDCQAYIAAHWNHFLEMSGRARSFNFKPQGGASRAQISHKKHNSRAAELDMAHWLTPDDARVVHTSKLSELYLSKHDLWG